MDSKLDNAQDVYFALLSRTVGHKECIRLPTSFVCTILEILREYIYSELNKKEI